MSYHLNVKGLAGLHLGKQITITTKNTEATGVLQGFRHDTDAINDLDFRGENWINGGTTTTITLLPNQRIVAKMGDAVVVHDETVPAPKFQSTGLQIINDNPESFNGHARGGMVPIEPGTVPWKVGDEATYCGVVDGKHLYVGGAAHQAEMNGATP